MSDVQLDPEEMDAIQAAIRESAPPRREARDVEPTPLALIADDRVGALARPVLLGLATHSIRGATRALRTHLGGGWQLDVVGVELVDGPMAKEELRGGWTAALQASDAELVIGVHGGVIDLAAARRCGASAPTADDTRAPSTVGLRLFEPAGRALLDGWTSAWRDMFGVDLAISRDLGIVSRLIEARGLVRVTLVFSGSVSGRVHVYTRPDVLVAPPAALAAVRANAQRIANALAHVPVELVVELGKLRMRLSDLRDLAPGATFTLGAFVDSNVPVYCEGVLKAWAVPIVWRGVLAVRITTVVNEQGTQS